MKTIANVSFGACLSNHCKTAADLERVQQAPHEKVKGGLDGIHMKGHNPGSIRFLKYVDLIGAKITIEA